MGASVVSRKADVDNHRALGQATRCKHSQRPGTRHSVDFTHLELHVRVSHFPVVLVSFSLVRLSQPPPPASQPASQQPRPGPTMADFKLSATLRGHEDDVRAAFTINTNKLLDYAGQRLTSPIGPQRSIPIPFVHCLCVARLHSTRLGTAVTESTDMGQHHQDAWQGIRQLARYRSTLVLFPRGPRRIGRQRPNHRRTAAEQEPRRRRRRSSDRTWQQRVRAGCQ